MTIRDLQKKIADALRGIEALVQNGCKVFAEDMLTTQNDLNNAVATAGRIAVVMVTPRFERDASGCVAIRVVMGCNGNQKVEDIKEWLRSGDQSHLQGAAV